MQIVVPQPSSLFPWGTVARKIYEALCNEGEVSNIRITRGLKLRYYADVIDQICETLRPFGLDIVRRRLAFGAWTYASRLPTRTKKRHSSLNNTGGTETSDASRRGLFRYSLSGLSPRAAETQSRLDAGALKTVSINVQDSLTAGKDRHQKKREARKPASGKQKTILRT